MTIRARLTLWYSGLLTVIIALFGVALIAVLNWTWLDQVQTSLIRVANQVISQTAVTPDGRILIQLPDMTELTGFAAYYIQVWNAEGEIISRSNPNYLQPLDRNALRNPEQDFTFSEQVIGDKHLYVLTYPLYASLNSPPSSLQIGTRLDAIDLATERLIRIMVGIGLIAVILSLVIGSIVAGRALEPIEIIAQAATQITAADDLSRRIPYTGPGDELGMLTVTFNATLERLERLFKSQRRFVADVSHELRTPLTTLQGNLDLIKRFGVDKASLDDMTSEISRMSRLVSDLLLLAKADAGLPLKKQTLDLDTLMMEVYRETKILAKEREHQIKLEGVDPARVNGDPDRLKQLLLNLVSNAVKYTPSGGTITLRMHREGSQAAIRVTDTGLGIPKSDLDLIFERFYRVDKARSRDMGGTGLGLSIAQWIAKAHNGQIRVESQEGYGSTFILELPILPEDSDPPISVDHTQQTRPSFPALRTKRSSQTQIPVQPPPPETSR
jgi:heavy metal sensor kinase